jgi:hypothetical protein
VSSLELTEVFWRAVTRGMATKVVPRPMCSPPAVLFRPLDNPSKADQMIRHSERRSAPTVVLGILSAATIFVFAFWVVPPFFHGTTTGIGITLGVAGKSLPRS